MEPYTIRLIASNTRSYDCDHTLLLPPNKLEQLHIAIEELKQFLTVNHEVELVFALPIDAEAMDTLMAEFVDLRENPPHDKSYGFMVSKQRIVCVILEHGDVSCERSQAYYDQHRPHFRSFLNKLDVVYDMAMSSTLVQESHKRANDAMNSLEDLFRKL